MGAINDVLRGFCKPCGTAFGFCGGAGLGAKLLALLAGYRPHLPRRRASQELAAGAQRDGWRSTLRTIKLRISAMNTPSIPPSTSPNAIIMAFFGLTGFSD